jgi:hypothetical protein
VSVGVAEGWSTSVRTSDRTGRRRTRADREPMSTRRRKFGVVCGDGVKTGIQTSLNAGVVLPTDCRTAPGESVLRHPDERT